jgi:bacterioferritin-associated ferredoxin
VIVCSCCAVNEQTARVCIAAGARTVESIGARCGAGTQCGGCRPLLDELIAEAAAVEAVSSAHNAA